MAASRGRGRPACFIIAMGVGRRAAASLSTPGDLIVGDNEPYTVDDETDYTIPVHGETRGIPHVAIEIRQDLIGDEGGPAAMGRAAGGAAAEGGGED